MSSLRPHLGIRGVAMGDKDVTSYSSRERSFFMEIHKRLEKWFELALHMCEEVC